MTATVDPQQALMITPQPSTPLMQMVVARSPQEISRVAFPTREEWERLMAYAELAVSAKINKTIENKAQAMVVALKGWHLGIDPMEAFQQIVIIDNKTTIQVQLMIALANRSGKLLKLDIPDPAKAFEEKKATVTIIRKDRPNDMIQATFTMEDAVRAKLAGKFIWQQYPGQMLVNRAVAIGLRRTIPEDLGLMHATEEIEPEEKQPQPPAPVTITTPTNPGLTSRAYPETVIEPAAPLPWWETADLTILVEKAVKAGYIESGQGAADLLKIIDRPNWKTFQNVKDAGFAIKAAIEKITQPPVPTAAPAPATTPTAAPTPESASAPVVDNKIYEVTVISATYNGNTIVFDSINKHGVLMMWSRKELAGMLMEGAETREEGEAFVKQWQITEWAGEAQRPGKHTFDAITLGYKITPNGAPKVVSAKPDPIPF